MRHTQKQIENMARLSKVNLGITKPGDGITHYEICEPGDKPFTDGRILGYCLGSREAYLFLRGYMEGRGERETYDLYGSAENGG